MRCLSDEKLGSVRYHLKYDPHEGFLTILLPGSLKDRVCMDTLSQRILVAGPTTVYVGGTSNVGVPINGVLDLVNPWNDLEHTPISRVLVQKSSQI
jgi:hypothetical protein